MKSRNKLEAASQRSGQGYKAWGHGGARKTYWGWGKKGDRTVKRLGLHRTTIFQNYLPRCERHSLVWLKYLLIHIDRSYYFWKAHFRLGSTWMDWEFELRGKHAMSPFPFPTSIKPGSEAKWGLGVSFRSVPGGHFARAKLGLGHRTKNHTAGPCIHSLGCLGWRGV